MPALQSSELVGAAARAADRIGAGQRVCWIALAGKHASPLVLDERSYFAVFFRAVILRVQ